MGYCIQAACGCHRGRVRSNNEDNFYFDGQYLPERNDGLPELLELQRKPGKGLLLAVFDGMGGEACGETAAYTAASTAREAAPKRWRQSGPEYLDALLRTLNQAVFSAGQALFADRMGATAVGLYATRRAVFGVNLGDSRAFLLRDGALTQLSVDHTDGRVLSHTGAQRKPRLTQHLGIDPSELYIEPHTWAQKPSRGDRYLLCSDGLTDLVSERQLADLLRADTPALCVQGLVAAALEAGGRDNITVLVAFIQ